jgi:hypothetical protein
MAGSCFSEHISEKMLQNGFHVESNPWGILFNPISLALMTQKLITPKDNSEYLLPIQREKNWFSLHQHSEISGNTEKELVNKVNQLTENASTKFQDSEVFIVTFGTAFVYEYLEKRNVIVANCQKVPNNLFQKRSLEIEEIVDSWSKLILQIPHKKIIFTVSPVRHSRDGLPENNLSKSILIIAIQQLIKKFPLQCFYFPSYEIVIDELRDYRFYKDDLVHPNEMAINYVWEKWCESFYDSKTLEISKAFHQVYLFAQHRTLKENKVEHLSKLSEMKLSLENRHPYLNYSILHL